MHEVQERGLDALTLTTALLHRARLAHPTAGLWEAADVQWWWRTPRASDETPQRFWIDDRGPVAAVLETEFKGRWQVDAILADPAVAPIAHERVIEAIGRIDAFEVPVRDDDGELAARVHEAGLVPVERSAVTWMDARDRPSVDLPRGFVLADRRDAKRPHHMRERNGESVEKRLRQCSLYDPELDLAVETEDGEIAGYSLYWFDPVTKVGLLEPMRVHEAYRRRGLARAMIAAGLDRLARRGAERMKVGYSSDAAGALYAGCGFRVDSTSTWYGRP